MKKADSATSDGQTASRPDSASGTVDNQHENGPSFSVDGVTMVAQRLPAGLNVVATPIGNLADITIRALQTLAGADLIACEDTRHSRKLLDHYRIRTPLTAYHEHNAAMRRPELLKQLADGHAIALISDAGTPLVSDPGFKLVEAAIADGCSVVPVPGPSAALASLVGAGLPTDRFMFCGFLSSKANARERQLKSVAEVQATLVFYEAPNRVTATLDAMTKHLGSQRPAVLAREITKRFETFERGTLSELAACLAGRTIKGECVILVAPALDTPSLSIDDPALAERLARAVAELGVKAASVSLADETGLQRRALYQRALELAPKSEE
ncbi:MAG: 16S rRNA (cytidine(1402)-2'-O)-methyltransferase [Pseudomonadota bacterium]